MLLRDLTIVAIDFETTGQVKHHTNLPWQLGAVVFRGAQILPEPRISLFLRVPDDHPFNPYTPGRWAELRETLAQAPSLPELWPQLAPWLTGHPLAAHNAPTERKMLRQAFPLQPFDCWIDTLRLARAAYPNLPSYALSDLLDSLELTPRAQALCPALAPHDACYDAVACALLLEHILALPQWHNLELEHLDSI
ncbi:MAG: hypothetical protein IJJ26_12090 [Victivallales bacterium]|nr:hypothetical protein [Victivallales bacterium]